MKNKLEWGNCSRCGKEITDKNLGGCIEAEELLVCDSCIDKHRLYVIAELNKFRQSKEFNDILALRKKLLWASESLANLFDNAIGTIIESVSDYNNYNVFELQSNLLDIELSCVEDILADEFGIPTKDNPKLQTLRKELINQIKKLASYF